MNRVRIRCFVPPYPGGKTPPTDDRAPFICGILPDFACVEVETVGDDGSTTPLVNVHRIEFVWQAGDDSPLMVKLTMFNPEVEIVSGVKEG